MKIRKIVRNILAVGVIVLFISEVSYAFGIHNVTSSVNLPVTIPDAPKIDRLVAGAPRISGSYVLPPDLQLEEAAGNVVIKLFLVNTREGRPNAESGVIEAGWVLSGEIVHGGQFSVEASRFASPGYTVLAEGDPIEAMLVVCKTANGRCDENVSRSNIGRVIVGKSPIRKIPGDPRGRRGNQIPFPR